MLVQPYWASNYGTFAVTYHDGTALSADELYSGINLILHFTNGRFEILFVSAAVLAAKTAAEAAATAAQGYAITASGEAAAAQSSAQQAQDLVEAASAGFTGFPDNHAYDFGYVVDPTTYFDQGWGSIAT